MHIACFTTFDELAPYADDWERLAAGVPFRSWTWLSHWWRHYGPQNDADALRTRLAVLGVFDDADALVGVAPWYLDCSAMHGRVLRPLGSGEVCSDYLERALPSGDGRDGRRGDGRISRRKRASTTAPTRCDWDLLELGGVDAEDRDVAGLVDAGRLGLHGPSPAGRELLAAGICPPIGTATSPRWARTCAATCGGWSGSCSTRIAWCCTP